LQDPDVINSDKELDYTLTIDFPQVPAEATAIDLVRHATLSVPGQGRSALTVQKTIDEFMKAPGMQTGRGWRAVRTQGDDYTVTFNFSGGGGEDADAIWTANVKIGRVRYVNKSAKIFSWSPNY
jgi:hypothetical protein